MRVNSVKLLQELGVPRNEQHEFREYMSNSLNSLKGII